MPCASHETQRKTVPVPESGEHGGKGGLRDEGLLESALARPKSLLAYGRPKDLYALAAAYGFGLAKNHPFFDGNKRVAFVAMLVFLEDNACLIEATEPDAVELMFGVAAGRIGERALATWLRSRAV
ncbi:MAG: type II toxin-antitoxin system death-on-curing family toxin [Acidobacteria bacterium]|nr:type II toxin-antitoxin system death-on-curing family toxin [Acidobacteriota bacterium]